MGDREVGRSKPAVETGPVQGLLGGLPDQPGAVGAEEHHGGNGRGAAAEREDLRNAGPLAVRPENCCCRETGTYIDAETVTHNSPCHARP